MLTCSQKGGGGCKEQAAYRYTWPGGDESFICEKHAPQIKNIAQALGLHLQLIPLSLQDHLTLATPAEE